MKLYLFDILKVINVFNHVPDHVFVLLHKQKNKQKCKLVKNLLGLLIQHTPNRDKQESVKKKLLFLKERYHSLVVTCGRQHFVSKSTQIMINLI